MKHSDYINLEEDLYMPDEYINIRIPLDASGDIENEIAKGVRRISTNLRSQASRVVSGNRPVHRGLTIEEYAGEAYTRADALSYQLTDSSRRHACFNKTVGRHYIETDQLRLVLVRIVLPFVHLDADSEQLVKDLELCVNRRVRFLKEEADSENSTRLKFSNRDRQYFRRMAKTLESVRVEHIKTGFKECPGDYHLIRDGKTGTKIRTKERYVR